MFSSVRKSMTLSRRFGILSSGTSGRGLSSLTLLMLSVTSIRITTRDDFSETSQYCKAGSRNANASAKNTVFRADARKSAHAQDTERESRAYILTLNALAAANTMASAPSQAIGYFRVAQAIATSVTITMLTTITANTRTASLRAARGSFLRRSARKFSTVQPRPKTGTIVVKI